MTAVTDFSIRNGLPRSLNRDSCRDIVRELVAEGGRVTFRKHAFDRMEERGISNAQVMQVLRRGEIVEGPSWSARYGNWEFMMQADAAGDTVNVKSALEVEQLMGRVVVVITAFAA
jgi:hypothetical protein